MPTTKQTTKQNGRARLSIVGFVQISQASALVVRVPERIYLLSSDAWGALRTRGHAWGTEMSRFVLEDEIGTNSVHWTVKNGAIIIEDLAEGGKFCLRFDDLMSIQPGQHLPVYGRDNPAWKYRSSVIAELERALPVVA